MEEDGCAYIATPRGSGNLWATEQVKLSRPTEELVSGCGREPVDETVVHYLYELFKATPTLILIVFTLPTNNYSDVVYFALAKL